MVDITQLSRNKYDDMRAVYDTIPVAQTTIIYR
jgi:hypothetical protein